VSLIKKNFGEGLKNFGAGTGSEKVTPANSFLWWIGLLHSICKFQRWPWIRSRPGRILRFSFVHEVKILWKTGPGVTFQFWQ